METVQDLAALTLESILKEKIARAGAIRFSEFMAVALYHPEWGYYTRRDTAQDFYTSPDVHPIFARILAGYFYEVWEKMARPDPFSLVELGPGEGRLAHGLLGALSQDYPECLKTVRYLGVEVSRARAERAQQRAAEFGSRIRFAADLPDRPVSGIIFSNEFFDALPVDRVAVENGSIQEILVGPDFKEVLSPARQDLIEYFAWLGDQPAEGCKGEAHLAARAWMGRLSQVLERGQILTIDYGFPAQELYQDFRPEGTALATFAHRTSRDYYVRPGSRDLTAHVNFTVLSKVGRERGLLDRKLLTQSQFLLEHGLESIVATMQSSGDARARLAASSAIKSLVHPEGMGGTFKVLVQERL